MKPNVLVISGLCLSSFFTNVYAADYYSSPSNAPAPNYGYSSSGSQPSQPANNDYRHRNPRVNISVNLSDQSAPVYVSHHSRPRHFRETEWISYRNNAAPSYMVVGGSQPQSPHTLFVCRGEYQGGIHPGKLVAGRCNIGYGGREIRLSRYEVLIDQGQLGWAASNGFIPSNAIPVGKERRRILYSCQAEYQGGMHPGKVVGNACNIGWGGREVALAHYNVLVRL